LPAYRLYSVRQRKNPWHNQTVVRTICNDRLSGFAPSRPVVSSQRRRIRRAARGTSWSVQRGSPEPGAQITFKHCAAQNSHRSGDITCV
jgi:hypothetical protein